jgi:hypothetical protein
VATRSSTRGTSRGVTVVTSTSGGGGPVCAGFLEHEAMNNPQISSALRATSCFINFIMTDRELKCRAQMRQDWFFASQPRECDPPVSTTRPWDFAIPLKERLRLLLWR